MSSQTIWDRMREKPFRPFRLNTSDGKGYEVPHPETIHVSKHRIIISIYDANETPGEDIASRDVTISPLHVASLEDLPARV